MLTPGAVIEVRSDPDAAAAARVRVGRQVGEGGQGWVFEALADNGVTYALKWYKTDPPPPTGQRKALSYLIDRGAPGPGFLWPLGLATATSLPSYGYLMPLRPPSYIGLVSLLRAKDEDGNAVDPSFAAIINLCHQLARNFLKLHASGLCYRDINYGNVFFHPNTGDVLVCDNDNVGVDGSVGSVVGTYGFMAPEVYLLLAGPNTPGAAHPSARTDRHSLAVTLFLAMMLAHPLEGKKTENGLLDARAWQLEHFGTDPLFIFDDDDRNRPLDDTPVRYWAAYPTFVRRLFTQAFTTGLRDPDARIMEGVWAAAMTRLRDALMTCASCGGTIFFDDADPDRACVRCEQSPGEPLFLAVGRKHRIVLGPQTRLWSDHLSLGSDASYLIGDVNAHPDEPTRWGIRNRTDQPWTATLPDGKVHQVPPGRTIEALPGTRIDFGAAEGEVTR